VLEQQANIVWLLPIRARSYPPGLAVGDRSAWTLFPIVRSSVCMDKQMTNSHLAYKYHNIDRLFFDTFSVLQRKPTLVPSRGRRVMLVRLTTNIMLY